MSALSRIGAICRRHSYVLFRNRMRILEVIYWPILNVVVWGFTASFLVRQSSPMAHVAGALIGAALLWEALFRSNIGVAVSFLEETWSRNLGHLFVSPIRPLEYVASLLTMGTFYALIALLPAAALTYVLYAFNLFAMGLPLVGYFVGLTVMGWASGLFISSLILRFGHSAEGLAWSLVFLLSPLSGVFYPIDVLPSFLWPISKALPTTYVFEGMRRTLAGEGFSWALFGTALALDVLYVIAAVVLFLVMVRGARRRGRLLDVGG